MVGRLSASGALLAAGVTATVAFGDEEQTSGFDPVTDAMLADPPAEDWLTWRRTNDAWGYSPLDQITTENVAKLEQVWTRPLRRGSQTATPLVYDGVMYMPNPNDVIQALDATTGDLIWEHERETPEAARRMGGLLGSNNRNIAIYGNLIIDTSVDLHLFALDAGDRRNGLGDPGPRLHKAPRHPGRPGRSLRAARPYPDEAVCRTPDPTLASSSPSMP